MKPEVSPGAKIAVGSAGAFSAFLAGWLMLYESGPRGPILTPYEDVAHPGLWTVCNGITNRAAPGWVVPGKKYTVQECEDKEESIVRTQIDPVIKRVVKVQTTQRVYEMLVSLFWNVGTGRGAKSDVVAYLNAGNCAAAVQAFHNHEKAGGIKWPGLVKRRTDESKQFGDWCGK